MTATLTPPTERRCERCGRRDVWDAGRDTWTIATENGERRAGDVYCIHEWDINGTYDPVR